MVEILRCLNTFSDSEGKGEEGMWLFQMETKP
jgi:hypothetical protein